MSPWIQSSLKPDPLGFSDVGVYYFLRAAVTNHHNLGDLKQQTQIISHLWRTWYCFSWDTYYITDDVSCLKILFICESLISNRNTDHVSWSLLLQLSVMCLLWATTHWVVTRYRALETGHWDTLWRRFTITIRSKCFHDHFLFKRGIWDTERLRVISKLSPVPHPMLWWTSSNPSITTALVRVLQRNRTNSVGT